jgi:hypothetical protein
MKFYLGTHQPSWLTKVEVPLFISRRRLYKRKTLPQALGNWALDSGGFTELSMFGKWTISAKQYALEVQRFTEIGHLDWVAPQDWMCEPWIIKNTGLTVEEHLQRTVNNYLELKELGVSTIPVLQGWQLSDYERCAELYRNNGVDLSQCETVGLGSVCRRQATNEIKEISSWGKEHGWKLHGFGVKAQGLKKYSDNLFSADSMAWSFGGRRRPDPNCPLQSCANCLHYALTWREKVLSS